MRPAISQIGPVVLEKNSFKAKWSKCPNQKSELVNVLKMFLPYMGMMIILIFQILNILTS